MCQGFPAFRFPENLFGKDFKTGNKKNKQNGKFKEEEREREIGMQWSREKVDALPLTIDEASLPPYKPPSSLLFLIWLRILYALSNDKDTCVPTLRDEDSFNNFFFY